MSPVRISKNLNLLSLLFVLFFFVSCLGSKGSDPSSNVSADSSAECSDVSDDSVLSASQSSWNSSLVLTDGSSIATSRDIKLTLSARNDKKIDQYYLSEDPAEPTADASGWVAVTETTDFQLSDISFRLSTNDGEKTIHGWFKDTCGEISPVASLKITLDTAIPVGTMVLAGGAASTNSLSIAVKMAGSVVGDTPIVSYFLSETNEAPASDSASWIPITTPSSGVVIETNFSLSARSGEHTIYGWFKSQTGRVSSTIQSSITFSLPTVASGATPVVQEGLTVNSSSTLTASFSINSGASFTNSRTISVSISGLSSANITHYELTGIPSPLVGEGQGEGGRSWTSVSANSSLSQTVSYQLSANDGLKTIYLHLKDDQNTTATAQAAITLDITAPTGTLKLDNGAKLTVDAEVSAGVSGSDGVGVTGYYLSTSFTAPGINDSGWAAVTSTASLSTSINRTLTDLTGLSTQYLWLKDAAGNVSTTISDGIEVVRIYATSGSNDFGQYSSITLDSSGNPFFSMYRVNGTRLVTARFSGGSFVFSTIDSSADVGSGTSIAIDSSNHLHIAYRDTTNGTLKYATNAPSGTWGTPETIEPGGISPSIGIDSNGKVHISHQASNKVRYVTNASGSWMSQVVLSNGSFGNTSSLAVAPNNSIHIVGEAVSSFQYATNQSGAWQESTITSGNDTGRGPYIAVSEDGILYVSHLVDNGNLGLAENAGSSWDLSTIDPSTTIRFNSVAIDSQGHAHVIYYDRVNEDLKYTTNFSGTWSNVTLDSSGNVGDYPDIAIDSNDRLHISYYDATNGDLKYATTAD